LAALRCADLSLNRAANDQFTSDRMPALGGNTAPNLLYAVLRIAVLARKGGEPAITEGIPLFTELLEWVLTRDLLRLDAVAVEAEKGRRWAVCAATCSRSARWSTTSRTRRLC
jgi:arginyl-tRNA synthetase